MHTVDWEDLRYVLALSRAQSLSVAASRLGVSHTTVGRRIRNIEDVLGVRLFDRTPDAFIVTPAGQDIAEVLMLEGRVLGRDAQLEGRIRVTTMDMLFRRYHTAFSSFLERYPLVDLTVTASDDVVSLPRREADVAIRMTNKPPEYLVGRKVGRVSFCVFGEKNLVERMGRRATYADFPWIHWDERLHIRPIDEWFETKAPGARIAMRIGVTGTAMSMARDTVATGIGVHFLATFDGDSDPRLARIGEPETQFDNDVWLLTLPDLRNTNRIRAFMDHMGERIPAIEAAVDAPSMPSGASSAGRQPKKPPPRRGDR